MGIKNVFIPFALLARFCLAVFAFSSALTFAAAPNWQPSRSTIYKDNIHFDVGSGDGVVRKGNQFQQLSKSSSPKMGGKPLAALRVGSAANDASIKNGVKGLLRGGLAGVAITQGIGALFDSVDWVLDPTNNMPLKLDTRPVEGFGPVPIVVQDGLPSNPNYRCMGNVSFAQWAKNVTNTNYTYPYGGNPPRQNVLVYTGGTGQFSGYYMCTYQCGEITEQRVRCKEYDNGEAQNDPNLNDIFSETGLFPVDTSDINLAVDNNYVPHDSDVSQLVNKNFVNPNVVFIGDSDNFNVDDSTFAFSSNRKTVSVPAGSPVSRVDYNGKPLDIRLSSGLPNHVSSVDFDISQSNEYDVDVFSSSETISIAYPSSSSHTFDYNGVPLTISVPPNPNNLDTLTLNIDSNETSSYSYVIANPRPIAPPVNEPFPQSAPLPAPNISIIYNTNVEYIVNGEPAGSSQTQTDTNQLPADNPQTLFDRIRQNDLLFESLPSFCTWAWVVCDFISWFQDPPEPPEDGDFESLRPINLPIGSLETDILEADKNCPAPKELTIASLNTTLTFKYDQICSAVMAINPFFLIICYISAARIVLRA